MFSCNRRPRTSPHPLTGELHDWTVQVDGHEVAWQSYAGPVRLDETDIAIASRKLLSIEPCDLLDMVLEHVEFSSPADGQSRLIVHSTTPFARGFETDLTAMVEGRPVSDLTTYVETRGLYLARSGDLAVGRTRPWRRAVAKQGVRRLALPDTDHTTCRTRCCAGRLMLGTAILCWLGSSSSYANDLQQWCLRMTLSQSFKYW